MLRRLGTFNDLEVSQRSSSDNDLEETVSITGLETFALSYKVFSFLYILMKVFLPFASLMFLLLVLVLGALATFYSIIT